MSGYPPLDALSSVCSGPAPVPMRLMRLPLRETVVIPDMTDSAPQLLFVDGRESLVGAALSSKRVIGASSERSDHLGAAESVELASRMSGTSEHARSLP